MDKNIRLQNLESQISKVKSKLLALGEMRPGSLSRQFNTCRSPGCKCKDPTNPQKHGPYYQLSYVRHAKSTSQAVPRDYVPRMKRQLATYKLFKKPIDEWIALALDHARVSLELSKEE